MKRMRTIKGDLVFLPEADYMPQLLAYLRESAGNDAADLVEDWAKSVDERYIDSITRAETALDDAVSRASAARRELREAQEEHYNEIEELEAELTRLSELKDLLMESNYVLTDLINNPEKLFPAIGTQVYRDTKDGRHDVGQIYAYKLRMDSTTDQPEFFVKVHWTYAGNSWSKFKNLGYTFHILPEEDVRV